MADLVREDRSDLVDGVGVDKGVEEHDALAGEWETSEVGVGVRGALGAVNDEDLVEWEADLLGEGLDGVLELAIFEWGEGVEQRHDVHRDQGHGEKLDREQEQADVPQEVGLEEVKDLEETVEHRSADGNTKQRALNHVSDPDLDSELVETEFLLEDEVLVVREWQLDDGRDVGQDKEEPQTLGDGGDGTVLHGEQSSGQRAAHVPQTWHEVPLDERNLLGEGPHVRDDGESDLGLGIRLRLLKGLLVNLILEHWGQLVGAERLVLSVRDVGLEEELAGREADDDGLPGDVGAVAQRLQGLKHGHTD